MNLIWNFILTIVAVAAGLWVIVAIIPGIDLQPVENDGFGVYISAAAVFVMVNSILTPLVRWLTGPITCATLGLFSLVVNGVMLLIVKELFNAFELGHLTITGLTPAIFGAVILGVVTSAVNFFTHPLRDL